MLATIVQADKQRVQSERDSLMGDMHQTGDRATRVSDGLRVVRDHLTKENEKLRHELGEARENVALRVKEARWPQGLSVLGFRVVVNPKPQT